MRNQTMRKMICATIAVACGIGFVAVSSETAIAASGVAINEKNFPDKTFRETVKGYDSNKDGILSKKETLNAKTIGFIDKKEPVKSLKGIEYLTEMICLYCEGNEITSLDLSKNTKLETLDCYDNKLSYINVSNCPKLHRLYCEYNELTSLDVSNCSELTSLRCSDNKLKSLDVSKNIKLVRLECSSNRLTDLDVSKNTALKYNLDCSANKISKLDISNNKELMRLDCTANKITSLDVTNNRDLIKLSCADNQIDKLDVSKNISLVYLECGLNKMSQLDVTTNDQLQYCYWGYQSEDIVISIKAGQSLVMESEVKVDSNKIIGLKKTVWTDKTWPDLNEKIDVWKITGKQVGNTMIDLTGKLHKVNVLYKDVTNPKDFWYEPTYYLMEKDVVKGYDNQTKFKPDNDCTRAQMVTFLWRLNGQPKPKSSKTDFTDIKKGDYYYKAVLWAVEQGITTGASKTKFNPEGVCTRAQTVTFLWRMAGKPSIGTSKNRFNDVKPGDYFYDAVIWASKKKIVAGYSDGTFKPQGKCLRRQMVTFLYKYDKYVNGKGYSNL